MTFQLFRLDQKFLDEFESQGLGSPDYEHVSIYKQIKVKNPGQISDVVANEVLQPIYLIDGDQY